MSTPRSGLLALKRAVGAYFTLYDVQADVLIGLKARSLWSKPRVILIPGRFDGGNEPKVMAAGPLDAPLQKASLNPRELASWPRELTLSIYARDVTQPQDEESQIVALDDLHELTVQALWNGIDPASGQTPGGANLTFGEQFYVAPPVVDAAGREMLLQVKWISPVFDQANPTATPTLRLGKQLQTAPNAGTKASVAYALGSLTTVSGLGFQTPACLGQLLTLSGAASSGNNGSFRIVQFVGPSIVVVQNAAAVAPDANNGAIAWQVAPPS